MPAYAASEKSPSPFAELVELEDGDTFIFLGDSITHQCLYSQYVETYFYTRYPHKRIHFRNAGVSGDQVGDALLRFEEEVAVFEADYVSVLLGMNDGRYRYFDHEIFSRYEIGMGQLLDQLGNISEVIPMGPTYFDTRSVRLYENAAHWVNTRDEMRDYYPPVLAFYSEWVAERAQLGGFNFVDMATPMRRLTFAQRRKDPSFTLAKDAVHPEAKGHVVMATAMLQDAFKIEPVSEIMISLNRKGRIEKSDANGLIENLVSKKGHVSFDFTATALPWVLPYSAHEGFELVNAAERFSRESLQVSGLKEGEYELNIDLVPIGRYSDVQLAMGIELHALAHAPQYKQAMAVATLNKDRNEQAIKPMRDLWLSRKVKLRSEESWLEESQAHPDYTPRKASYDAEMDSFYSTLKELEALAMEFEDKIYAANEVPPRSYSLTLVD
ncbi:SGNH/GDSL hydrolase family protein [Pelagicoccus sp. SDUM812002]|uniref:SGNH/GDSL hydrolase family protein n=1 Tax=Pelagicoccus sp. SDUM812002 TaxID=3041266 RepID=UPI0028101FFD|nr:SGNH/GDSL hydrolase family protein [Pelagicoccus sp. SDUM812002]MDQ8187895.1 SGNH/GDSL hydrolase family protein [Pelagicoccus sp. SDUM812002]